MLHASSNLQAAAKLFQCRRCAANQCVHMAGQGELPHRAVRGNAAARYGDRGWLTACFCWGCGGLFCCLRHPAPPALLLRLLFKLATFPELLLMPPALGPVLLLHATPAVVNGLLAGSSAGCCCCCAGSLLAVWGAGARLDWQGMTVSWMLLVCLRRPAICARVLPGPLIAPLLGANGCASLACEEGLCCCAGGATRVAWPGFLLALHASLLAVLDACLCFVGWMLVYTLLHARCCFSML